VTRVSSWFAIVAFALLDCVILVEESGAEANLYDHDDLVVLRVRRGMARAYVLAGRRASVPRWVVAAPPKR